MENQHRKIAGYRELSAAEIDLINDVKRQEQVMLGIVASVQSLLAQQAKSDDANARLRMQFAEPQRWASIAKTHIQEGASALVRAIAQPL